MSANINDVVLDQYSKQAANNLAIAYFHEKPFVTGDEIVSGSLLPQVNLFIIHHIYQNWQKETTQLKSPYFDYEHPAVKDGLQKFSNTLSKYIQLDRANFVMLAEKAVKSSILLALKPQMFLANIFPQGNVTIHELQTLLKYIRYNTRLFEGFCEHLKKEKTVYYTNELNLKFESFLKDQPGLIDNNEKIISDLNKFVPINENQLWESEVQKEPQESVLSSRITEREARELPNKALTYIDLIPPSNTPTINDQLSQKENSLHNKLLKTKVQDIKSAIPINKKFLFVNELFNGNSEDYNQALSDIESSSDYNQAFNTINEKYSTKYAWTIDNPALEELCDLIDRRFV